MPNIPNTKQYMEAKTTAFTILAFVHPASKDAKAELQRTIAPFLAQGYDVISHTAFRELDIALYNNLYRTYDAFLIRHNKIAPPIDLF